LKKKEDFFRLFGIYAFKDASNTDWHPNVIKIGNYLCKIGENGVFQ